MLIYGTAGTGKSFLIRAIAQLLGSACLLTGTTGIAGFNICGSTLHSALHLPIQLSSGKDLQGSALARLQQRFKDVQYLIIDEVSMLGQRMLYWVDKRLRQATGHLNVCLGGVSVILIGDFGQLPPVGDRPLYASDLRLKLDTQYIGNSQKSSYLSKYCDRMVMVMMSLDSVTYSKDSEMGNQQWTTGICFYNVHLKRSGTSMNSEKQHTCIMTDSV